MAIVSTIFDWNVLNIVESAIQQTPNAKINQCNGNRSRTIPLATKIWCSFAAHAFAYFDGNIFGNQFSILLSYRLLVFAFRLLSVSASANVPFGRAATGAFTFCVCVFALRVLSILESNEALAIVVVYLCCWPEQKKSKIGNNFRDMINK